MPDLPLIGGSQPQGTVYTEQGYYQKDFPDMGRMGSREYSEAHYKFLASLLDSQSARSFFEQITNTDFSHQCILEFHKILTSGFDRNAMLANNPNLSARVTDFELLLNFMVLGCHESDLQNPAFLTFQENILSTFKDFISRSQSGKERDKLLRNEYGVTTQEQPMPRERGFGTGGAR
jgi:hypothetical protein